MAAAPEPFQRRRDLVSAGVVAQPSARSRRPRAARTADRFRRRCRPRARAAVRPRVEISFSARRRRVADPEAERERAGPRGRAAVEDDVVVARAREDGSGDGHRSAVRGQVRIRVEREPDLAEQLVLVARAHDARLDPVRPAEDGDAEVRDRARHGDPEHLLRAEQGTRHAEDPCIVRIAVRVDERRVPARVALVGAGARERGRLRQAELRRGDAEPERDPPAVGASLEHDEPRVRAPRALLGTLLP